MSKSTPIFLTSALLLLLPVAPCLAQSRLAANPAPAGGNLSRAAAKAPVRRIAGVRTAMLFNGSKVSISSDEPIEDYHTVREDGRMVLVMPNAIAPGVGRLKRVSGLVKATVEQQGPDAIFTFDLEPGAVAFLHPRFNHLDVVINTAEAVAAAAAERRGGGQSQQRWQGAESQQAPTPRADECDTRCRAVPDEITSGDYLEVDANTGQTNGVDRFRDGGAVVFKNLNRFKYSYSFPSTVSSAEANIAAILLTRIFAQSIIAPGAESVAAAATDKARLVADGLGATGTCTGIQDREARERLLQEATKLANESRALKAELKDKVETFNKSKDEYNDFLEATAGDVIDCNDVCQKARTLLPQLRKLNLGDIPKRLADLKTGTRDLEAFVRGFTPVDSLATNAACQAEVRTIFGAVVTGVNADVKSTEESLSAFQEELRKNQDKFEQLAKIIGRALSADRLTSQIVYLRATGEAKDFEFGIRRTNLREGGEPQTIGAVIPVRVGTPRLSVSAGIGFSTINEVKYNRQAALVPNEDGTGTTLGSVFGFENKSKFRPSAVLMLNGRVGHIGNSTLALSAGIVFSDRSEGLAAEFIAGPSIGFLDDTMFVTAGFHAARVEQLNGNFKEGDPVPANLTDLPVEKNWRNGLMFAITFNAERIFSRGNSR